MRTETKSPKDRKKKSKKTNTVNQCLFKKFHLPLEAKNHMEGSLKQYQKDIELTLLENQEEEVAKKDPSLNNSKQASNAQLSKISNINLSEMGGL